MQVLSASAHPCENGHDLGFLLQGCTRLLVHRGCISKTASMNLGLEMKGFETSVMHINIFPLAGFLSETNPKKNQCNWKHNVAALECPLVRDEINEYAQLSERTSGTFQVWYTTACVTRHN